MILNSHIWKETVAAAKAKASTSPAWLRAIDRAVTEIERAKYWSFADGTLTIISTTSGKRYVIGEAHTCEARGSVCKHRAARRLMMRYVEQLAPERRAPTAPAPAAISLTPQPAAVCAQLIADVKAAWHRARPFASLAGAVHQVFGVMRLEDVATDDLRRALAALEPHQAEAERPLQQRPTRRQSATRYRQALHACARGRGSVMALYGLALRAGLTTDQAETDLNAQRAA